MRIVNGISIQIVLLCYFPFFAYSGSASEGTNSSGSYCDSEMYKKFKPSEINGLAQNHVIRNNIERSIRTKNGFDDIIYTGSFPPGRLNVNGPCNTNNLESQKKHIESTWAKVEQSLISYGSNFARLYDLNNEMHSKIAGVLRDDVITTAQLAYSWQKESIKQHFPLKQKFLTCQGPSDPIYKKVVLEAQSATSELPEMRQTAVRNLTTIIFHNLQGLAYYPFSLDASENHLKIARKALDFLRKETIASGGSMEHWQMANHELQRLEKAAISKSLLCTLPVKEASKPARFEFPKWLKFGDSPAIGSDPK